MILLTSVLKIRSRAAFAEKSCLCALLQVLRAGRSALHGEPLEPKLARGLAPLSRKSSTEGVEVRHVWRDTQGGRQRMEGDREFSRDGHTWDLQTTHDVRSLFALLSDSQTPRQKFKHTYESCSSLVSLLEPWPPSACGPGAAR